MVERGASKNDLGSIPLFFYSLKSLYKIVMIRSLNIWQNLRIKLSQSRVMFVGRFWTTPLTSVGIEQLKLSISFELSPPPPEFAHFVYVFKFIGTKLVIEFSLIFHIFPGSVLMSPFLSLTLFFFGAFSLFFLIHFTRGLSLLLVFPRTNSWLCWFLLLYLCFLLY